MGSLDALLKRIQSLNGIQDSRGPVGMYSRGRNVYGSSLAAHRGPGFPGQFGRPPKNAISRRLKLTGGKNG